MRKLSSNYIIRKLLENDVYYFTPKFLSSFLDLERKKVYNLLKTLKKKDLIKEVEKGKYFVFGFEPEKILSNPFFIANKIVTPSYVSFWNALNYYNFTEQAPRKIFLVTTKKKNDVKFEEYRFKYVKFDPKKFFGYQRKESFLIAEKEKAIIDSLFMPQYSGGLSEIFKSLKNAFNKIDINKLQEYAIKMRNKSLCARLGFMMEKIGREGEELRKYLPKNYIKLNPSREKSGKINKKWKIYINFELE